MRKIVLILLGVICPFVLFACGTLNDAQDAYDSGEYKQAIKIIKESEENFKEDEELNEIYINSYKKWAEKLVGSGKCAKAIKILDKSDIASEDIAETYYAIGEGFVKAKQFSSAGVAYAKAGDYSDAEEKSKLNWDKGARRSSISVSDYIALGIKEDGTVLSTKNDELIKRETAKPTKSLYGMGGSVEANSLKNLKTGVKGWKNMVSVISTDYYCAGLTNDGEVKTSDTGYSFSVDDKKGRSLDTLYWSDIVSISMDFRIIAGLDKYGEIHLGGENASQLWKAEEWTNIIDIALLENEIIGIDISGRVHIVSASKNYYGYDNNEIYAEEDFKDKRIKKCSFIDDFGVYITADGNLETTVEDDFEWGSLEMKKEDFSGFTADEGEFVQCEANTINFVGLKNDGTVKVGGDMRDLLEGFGAKKWHDIKEVHIGIGGENPVIIGLTSNGSIKLAGFEGADYIPFHKRIKAWGKLKKPTFEL